MRPWKTPCARSSRMPLKSSRLVVCGAAWSMVVWWSRCCVPRPRYRPSERRARRPRPRGALSISARASAAPSASECRPSRLSRVLAREQRAETKLSLGQVLHEHVVELARRARARISVTAFVRRRAPAGPTCCSTTSARLPGARRHERAHVDASGRSPTTAGTARGSAARAARRARARRTRRRSNSAGFSAANARRFGSAAPSARSTARARREHAEQRLDRQPGGSAPTLEAPARSAVHEHQPVRSPSRARGEPCRPVRRGVAAAASNSSFSSFASDVKRQSSCAVVGRPCARNASSASARSRSSQAGSRVRRALARSEVRARRLRSAAASSCARLLDLARSSRSRASRARARARGRPTSRSARPSARACGRAPGSRAAAGSA